MADIVDGKRVGDPDAGKGHFGNEADKRDREQKERQQQREDAHKAGRGVPPPKGDYHSAGLDDAIQNALNGDYGPAKQQEAIEAIRSLSKANPAGARDLVEGFHFKVDAIEPITGFKVAKIDPITGRPTALVGPSGEVVGVTRDELDDLRKFFDRTLGYRPTQEFLDRLAKVRDQLRHLADMGWIDMTDFPEDIDLSTLTMEQVRKMKEEYNLNPDDYPFDMRSVTESENSVTKNLRSLIGGDEGEIAARKAQLDFITSHLDVVQPILLDLNGNGIEVAELSESNLFFDTTADGYKHRTAWAGAGDGVLAIDADGDGQITERKEIAFTDWDPGAKDDMAALRSVFDTNDNGKLDSGDAEFLKFRIVVTNADGTTSVKTLAEAGVESINLITDSTQYTLSDGSSVDGVTTYDKIGGGTGKAAAVTFVTDAQGYAITNSTVGNPDGSTTITNVGRNANGSIANVTVTNTSADGFNRTITFDYNGDGVVDNVQTIVTVLNGDGSKTETITNRNGGNVLLDRTETTTSADGNSVSISRDTRGGGYFNETETRATTGGSLAITLSQLNPNGTVISSKTTATTSDGLTRTENYDLDGNATADLEVIESTVVNGNGSRSETLTTKSGNGTLLSKTVTDIDSTGEDRTSVTDADGDKDTDLTRIVTVDQVDGSTITTQTDKNGDTSTRSQTVTSISGDSLTYITKVDSDGDGDYDVTRADVTVINGDGSRTQTITETNADGSVRDQTIIVKSADGRGRDIQTDRDGDGINDQTRTIVIAGDGSSVDTINELNRDGSVSSKSIASTSANGLTVDTQIDADGNGSYETVTKSVTLKNGDGSSTVTKTIKNADTSLRGSSVTKTSANGLSVTVELDRDGIGGTDWTTSDVTLVSGDGSYVQTVTDKFGNGTKAAQSVTSVSATRDDISITRDLNGDGFTDQTEIITRQTNGELVDTVINKSAGGTTIDKMVTTTSASGLSTTVEFDRNGDGDFDRTRITATTIEPDGDKVTVTTDKAGTSQVGKVTQTVSGNGLTITTDYDLNGDNIIDLTTEDVTDLKENGSAFQTRSNHNKDGSLRDQVTIETSDDGLSVTTDFDFDGNTIVDLHRTDVTVLNGDGSATRTVTNKLGGSVRDEVAATTSADGRKVTSTSISNGSVNTKQTYSRDIADNGGTVEILSKLGAADALLNRLKTTTSANGLVVTRQTDQNGDGVYDYAKSSMTSLNINGSRTETVTNTNAAGLINKSVTTVSGNGLVTTVQSDRDGNGAFDLTTASTRMLNVDGSVVDTVTHTSANGTQFSKTLTTTSGDRKTVTIDRYDNGANVQHEVRVLENDGDAVATVTSKKQDGTLLSTVTTTTSANGLYKQVQAKNAAGTVIDTQTTNIVLEADGDRTETFTQVQPAGGVGSTITTTTSADGLIKTQSKSLTGALSAVVNTADQTVLYTDGRREQTITVTNGGGIPKDKAVITTTDDGLSISKTLDVNGNNIVDNTYSSITKTDGSKVESAIYNKLTGGLRRSETTNISIDGRNVTLNQDTDGNGVTDLTVTTVKNADGSITETRIGAALGGVPAFTQVSKTEIDLDGGTKMVTEFFNGSGVLTGRTITKNAANGLGQAVTFDVNGDGIVDKQSSKTVTIAANGETTETERFSLVGGIPSSTRVTITTADGAKTTTQLDLDGNGINEQQSVTTLQADGSIVYDYKTVNNDTGTVISTQSVTVGINGKQLSKSTYDTIVASLQLNNPSQTWQWFQSGRNEKPEIAPQYEVVYTVKKSTLQDTFTLFAGTNGDSQWIRTDGGTQTAKSLHVIDANGVDTWSWSITNSGLFDNTSFMPISVLSGSIQIDVATRDLYLERADNIMSAAFSRELGADERELLAVYIKSDGTLDESAFALKILGSAEFTNKYGMAYTALDNTQFVTRLFMNAFGHLPSTTLRDYYVGLLVGGMSRANLLVALGSGIESGQITRSDWQNGTINDAISYLTAGSGVTVDLANNANNAGGAAGDKYITIKDVVGSNYNDTLKGDGKSNALSGAAGNDSLDGGVGNDILIGGAGNDTLTGGLANDTGKDTARYAVESAGVRVDLSSGVATGASTGTDTLSNIENVVGSSHDDVLIGSAGANALAGGQGIDLLKGGAGNDTYQFNIGDGHDEIFDTSWSTQSNEVSTGTKTLKNSYSYTSYYWYPGTGADGNGAAWKAETITKNVSINVGTYNIVIDPLHDNAGTNDVLQLGSGIAQSDLVFEFRGSDLYLGVKDANWPTAKASALSDSIRLVNWLDTLDRVETLKFFDGTTMSVATLVGTIPNPPSLTSIPGTTGSEGLTGTANGDLITGGDGNDTITAGKGDDRLEGGKGDDAYVFTRGDGWDVIRDEDKYLKTTTVSKSYSDPYQKTYSYTYTDSSGQSKTGSKTVTFTDNGTRNEITNQWQVDDGGNDTLKFATGITIEDVAVKLVGDDLLIVLRDPGNPAASFWELTDRMRIENWTDLKNRVEKFQFADGTIIDVNTMVAAETGAENADTITGDAATNWIAGSGGSDTLLGMGGNDVIIGGTGDDVIAGGAGADRVLGGAGSDTADYAASAAGVTVNMGAGSVSGGDAAGDVLTSIENVTGSSTGDSLTGDGGANRLVGGGGGDLLDGGGGNDVLEGGTGADTLTGGGGADLYQTSRGGGADQVTASLDDGSADRLAFKGNVDSDQLWFSQSGSDLVISIIGTNDGMTVKGWYTAGNDRLDRIETGDGDYLLANDVQSLVTAMASLTAPPVGQTKLSAPQQQQLATTLAAAWHPS